MDTLFEPLQPDKPQEARPLAARMRPLHLEEFVGQTHLLGEGSGLRTAIEQGHPHSMVLYGPPGSGKTTLARMVAERSRAVFEELSAVQAGRAEVRAVLERAAHRARHQRHRHGVLPRRDPPLQQGPAGHAAAGGRGGRGDADRRDDREPVRSRSTARCSRECGCTSCERSPREEVAEVLRRALDSGELDTAIAGSPETLDFLAARSDGDARTALNALELAVTTAAELGETSVDDRARRGRAAAPSGAVRPAGRPPLRHDLRLDQGDARHATRTPRCTTSR